MANFLVSLICLIAFLYTGANDSGLLIASGIFSVASAIALKRDK